MTLASVVARLQGDGLFQPFLRIVETVGKQRDATQLEGCRIVFGILSDDLRVEFVSFGKLPNLKEPIGRHRFLIASAAVSLVLAELQGTITIAARAMQVLGKLRINFCDQHYLCIVYIPGGFVVNEMECCRNRLQAPGPRG